MYMTLTVAESVTKDGSAFQTGAPATGKARSSCQHSAYFTGSNHPGVGGHFNTGPSTSE